MRTPYLDGGDIGVIERSQYARLSLEPAQTLLVPGERFTNDLDGDVTAQLGVVGLIHFAHPAGTDGL